MYAKHPVAIEELTRRGITYREAAAFVGVSHSHLWKALHGRAPLRPEVSERLAKLLGKAEWDLFAVCPVCHRPGTVAA